MDTYCNYIELWYTMLNELSRKGGEDYYDAIAYIEDWDGLFPSWFFPLAIYIHRGIVGLMKDSTPSLFIKDLMALQLTPKQEEVLMIVSEQEGRHPSQMLSLLIDNGIDFWYVDNVAPFKSERGVITDTSGTGLWEEAQNFHHTYNK